MKVLILMSKSFKPVRPEAEVQVCTYFESPSECCLPLHTEFLSWVVLSSCARLDIRAGVTTGHRHVAQRVLACTRCSCRREYGGCCRRCRETRWCSDEVPTACCGAHCQHHAELRHDAVGASLANILRGHHCRRVSHPVSEPLACGHCMCILVTTFEHAQTTH
jgi:hypothetical protein